MPCEEIYKLALEKWGMLSQIHMCSEEMSELNKELMKIVREGMSELQESALVDELADVMITVEQMILCFDVKDKVSARRVFKLARLEQLVTRVES